MDTFTVPSVALRLLVRKWHEREGLGTKVGSAAYQNGASPKNPEEPFMLLWGDSVAQKQVVGYEIALGP